MKIQPIKTPELHGGPISQLPPEIAAILQGKSSTQTEQKTLTDLEAPL